MSPGPWGFTGFYILKVYNIYIYFLARPTTEQLSAIRAVKFMRTAREWKLIKSWVWAWSWPRSGEERPLGLARLGSALLRDFVELVFFSRFFLSEECKQTRRFNGKMENYYRSISPRLQKIKKKNKEKKKTFLPSLQATCNSTCLPVGSVILASFAFNESCSNCVVKVLNILGLHLLAILTDFWQWQPSEIEQECHTIFVIRNYSPKNL